MRSRDVGFGSRVVVKVELATKKDTKVRSIRGLQVGRRRLEDSLGRSDEGVAKLRYIRRQSVECRRQFAKSEADGRLGSLHGQLLRPDRLIR